MSDGHADQILAKVGKPEPPEKRAPPIDPALYQRDDVRRILATRDIAALYRALKDEGVTQRTIAALTGQSQSEVSEILAGRKVLAYDVLVRIAAGLGIPRELMGLSYGADSAGSEDGAYPGAGGGPGPEMEEEMRRRALLAATSLAALGRVVTSLGELAELALPRTGDEPLPSRLGVRTCRPSRPSRNGYAPWLASTVGRLRCSVPPPSNTPGGWGCPRLMRSRPSWAAR